MKTYILMVNKATLNTCTGTYILRSDKTNTNTTNISLGDINLTKFISEQKPRYTNNRNYQLAFGDYLMLEDNKLVGMMQTKDQVSLLIVPKELGEFTITVDGSWFSNITNRVFNDIDFSTFLNT